MPSFRNVKRYRDGEKIGLEIFLPPSPIEFKVYICIKELLSFRTGDLGCHPNVKNPSRSNIHSILHKYNKTLVFNLIE